MSHMTNLTPHAHRVHTFMLRAGQTTPTVPTMPDEKTRILRAKLIFEEAMETITALGVSVQFAGNDILEHAHLVANKKPDLVEIVDGCADVSVVTIGTLLACGVEDVPVLEMVDASNMGKFGPGHSIRADGKVIKPPNFRKPDFLGLLRAQGWEG